MADNSNLDKAVSDYLLWLIDTGYAESTIYHYERMLIHFRDYIGSGTDSLDAVLSREIITGYERNSTLKDCSVSVWGLARYLHRQGKLKDYHAENKRICPFFLKHIYLILKQTDQ